LIIGNVQLAPTDGANGTTFDVAQSVTFTGALETSNLSSTGVVVTVSGAPGDPNSNLNFIGNSSSGVITGTSGLVSLEFQNNANLAIGGTNAQTFSTLTVNETTTTLTLDNASGASSHNYNNDTTHAITATTAETFTGGLVINSGDKLVVDGWQGVALGGTGSKGQLFFSNDGNTLPLGTEVTNVIFDLTANAAGPTTSPYDPGTGTLEGSEYDYGEWIADPNNSSLDELVPYAMVPEPATILGGLALLGTLVWRERRRLAALHGQFFAQPSTCA